MPSPSKTLPKMMLGFVVRRCAVAMGHEPTAEEFAAWANNYEHDGEVVRLFGKPITVAEARVILRYRGRPVSARGAAAHEQLPEDGTATAPLGANLVSFAAAAARAQARRKPGA